MIETIQCKHCPATFEWETEETDSSWLGILRPELCDDCEGVQEQEMKTKRENERLLRLQQAKDRVESKIKEDTPERFNLTSLGHSGFKAATWEKVRKWRPTADKPWLGFLGPTGACKTRMAFLLLKDVVVESAYQEGEFSPLRHLSYFAASHTEIAKWVTDQYDEKGGKTKALLRQARDADVLLIDDLGKAKPTAAVTSQIFDLLDHRHAHNLTTIWTANSTPEEIAAAMPPDMAAPLAGRINECSTIIRLK